jgi:hypothetical protein
LEKNISDYFRKMELLVEEIERVIKICHLPLMGEVSIIITIEEYMEDIENNTKLETIVIEKLQAQLNQG